MDVRTQNIWQFNLGRLRRQAVDFIGRKYNHLPLGVPETSGRS